MFTLPNQPQSVFDIIKDGFRLYKPVFLKVWPLTLILAFLQVSISMPSDSTKLPATVIILCLLGGLILIFIRFWLQLSLLHLVNQVIVQSKEGYKKALSAGIRKLFKVFIIILILFIIPILGLVVPAVLHSSQPATTEVEVAVSNLLKLFTATTYLGSMILFLFLLVPGIFSIVEAVLGREGIFGSIKEGFRITWGKWWRTIAVLFSANAIILLPILPILIPIAIAGTALLRRGVISQSLFLTIMLILIYVISFFWLPWSNTILVRQYHDLKLRYRLRKGI